MDGSLMNSDALFDPAAALMQLSNPGSERSDSESGDDTQRQTTQDCLKTPEPRSPVRAENNKAVYETPTKSFVATGYKRKNRDLIEVVYECDGGDTFSVPLARGETKEQFNQRRDQTLKLMYDVGGQDELCVALCTWNNQVVTLCRDKRWVSLRETTQQQRYSFKSLQLVVTRYTCTQWTTSMKVTKKAKTLHEGDRCRNCSNRHYRAGCINPVVLCHIMPMPGFRMATSVLDDELAEFDPITTNHKVETMEWLQRMPQVNCRM